MLNKTGNVTLGHGGESPCILHSGNRLNGHVHVPAALARKRESIPE